MHKQNHSAECHQDTTLIGVSCNQNNTVLLATTLVNITSANGNAAVVRAVLDSASQTTIISESCAKTLCLYRSQTDVPELSGISTTPVKTKGLTFVTLSSLSGNILAKSHPVMILNKISCNLPRVQLPPEIKERLKGYKLADPTFDVPGPVDLLIGADLFALTLNGTFINLGTNMPYAVNTIFGYVVLVQHLFHLSLSLTQA